MVRATSCLGFVFGFFFEKLGSCVVDVLFGERFLDWRSEISWIMVSKMHVRSGFYSKVLDVVLYTPIEDQKIKLNPLYMSQSYAQPL